jgi:hypothetical protein
MRLQFKARQNRRADLVCLLLPEDDDVQGNKYQLSAAALALENHAGCE